VAESRSKDLLAALDEASLSRFDQAAKFLKLAAAKAPVITDASAHAR